MCKNIQSVEDIIGNVIDEDDCEYDDWDDYDFDSDCPCDNCTSYGSCDQWEQRFCCTYCRWSNGHPDCKNCDPWDI